MTAPDDPQLQPTANPGWPPQPGWQEQPPWEPQHGWDKPLISKPTPPTEDAEPVADRPSGQY
ncbi:MAG TPA: hypothetical protein VH298_03950 [Jatrophihabitans sp.]|nr:hypothetical protein [Jatrophihabitans sp.]